MKSKEKITTPMTSEGRALLFIIFLFLFLLVWCQGAYNHLKQPRIRGTQVKSSLRMKKMHE